LSPEQVRDLLERGEADLIDVREPTERGAGFIAGSRHVPLSELGLDSARPDATIVFVCRSGARSAFATDAFRRAGHDAYNLEGGMLEWTRRGLPLAPSGGYVAEH
jgi:rhodanese-related sulfurtransferase